MLEKLVHERGSMLAKQHFYRDCRSSNGMSYEVFQTASRSRLGFALQDHLQDVREAMERRALSALLIVPSIREGFERNFLINPVPNLMQQSPSPRAYSLLFYASHAVAGTASTFAFGNGRKVIAIRNAPRPMPQAPT